MILYKTNQFTGNLKSSDEGKAFWVEREEFENLNLIWNMRELLEIFDTDTYSEFFFKLENGEYHGELLG